MAKSSFFSSTGINPTVSQSIESSLTEAQNSATLAQSALSAATLLTNSSLLKANNLSGLTNTVFARANMGLGDIATTSIADYLAIDATLEGGNF
jgi:hypothetical protein